MEHAISGRTADAVRAEIARRGISYRKLGAAIGWTLGTTSRRLNGISPITVDELTRIARYLNLPINALIDTHPPKPPARVAEPL